MSMLRSTKRRRGGRAAEPYVRVLAWPLGDELSRSRHQRLHARRGHGVCRWRKCESLLPRTGGARMFGIARAARMMVRIGDRRVRRAQSRKGGKALRQAVPVRRRRGRKRGNDENGRDEASRPPCRRHVPSSTHARKRTLSGQSGDAVVGDVTRLCVNRLSIPAGRTVWAGGELRAGFCRPLPRAPPARLSRNSRFYRPAIPRRTSASSYRISTSRRVRLAIARSSSSAWVTKICSVMSWLMAVVLVSESRRPRP